MSLLFKEKTASQSLFRVLQPQQASSKDFRLGIIVVPDLPSKTPRAALDSAWSQLRNALVDETIKPLILGFEYGLPRNVAIWTYLQSQSEVLVKHMISEASSHQLFTRPILFVAHGLGGLIVKQALVNVGGQYPSASDIQVRESCKGIIFFGTPHPTFAKKYEWNKLIHILKIGPKIEKLRLIEAELERLIVANISERFKKAATNISILSLCESKETKISTSFLNTPKYLLVNESFGATLAPFEESLSVELDHYEILRLPPKGEMLKRIRGLVKAISLRNVSQTSATGSSETTTGQINDELDESSVFSGELVEEPEEPGLASDEAIINSVTERSSSELPTLYEFASQEKTLKVPLYLLKPAVHNANFFGRNDILSLIDQKLLPSDLEDNSTQKSFALCGLGGVGKTQVAIEYAFSRRSKFDAIFWIDSDQPTQLAEGFSAIASQLGHTETPDQDRVVSRDIALEWLCNPRKRATANSPAPEGEAMWLLIFNNVDDLKHIQSFWPQCNLGSILITSRDPLAKRGRDGVDLEPFEPNEAAELLRKLLNLPDTEENIETSVRLAERLGGLPLAINQVAALIERWEMTLKEFCEHLDSQTSIARVAKSKPSDTHDHYKHSLFTVWALDSLTAGAWALLQVIAFLNPDSIREGLLQQDGPEGTANYPQSDDDFIDARTDLLKVSLIKRNKPTKNDPEQDGELTLHRLVQDVAQAQTNEVDVPEILKFVLRLLLSSWPTDFLQFDHDSAIWTKCGELLPHILRIQPAIKRYRVFESSINDRKDYARLLLFAGWYLFERIDFEVAKPLYLDVLALCPAELTEMAEIQADVLFALSALSAQINEKVDKTLSYAEQHYEARLKLRDGSELGEARMAMAYGELAHIQMIAGKYEDAIKNTKEAIDMTRKSPRFLAGEDWPTFSHSHQAFSLAALGQYDEALELVDATLKYWNTHSSETHAFALGLTHRCLGYIRRKQGLQRESKDAWLTALEHFKSAFGDKSNYTSQCCRNLGTYHSQQGNFETAITYFEQALRGYRTHSFYKPELAWTLFCLSEARRANGDETGAKGDLKEALELYKQVGNGNPEATLSSADFEKCVYLPSR